MASEEEDNTMNTSAVPWLRKNPGLPVTWVESRTGQDFVAYYSDVLEAGLHVNRLMTICDEHTVYFNEYLNLFNLLDGDDDYLGWNRDLTMMSNGYPWVDFNYILHMTDSMVYVEIKYSPDPINLWGGVDERRPEERIPKTVRHPPRRAIHS